MLLNDLCTKTGFSAKKICGIVKVPYASYMRWQGRKRRGEPVLQKRGPSKISFAALPEIKSDVLGMRHGAKRSRGAGALQSKYAQVISRRDLLSLVQQVRQEKNQQHKESIKTIQWHIPGSCWSMDMSEYGYDTEGIKLFVHQIQDLASRYKFPPLGGGYPCGEELAAYLHYLFEANDPPLVLKRDNGTNMTHSAVDEVLAEYGVLPLNNPPYYAPYNGAIEHAFTELKKNIRIKLKLHDGKAPAEHFEVYAQNAAHELNHKPRKALKGNHACYELASSKKRAFNKKERRAIYDCICNLTNDILCSINYPKANTFEKAWRIAVEYWLQKENFISISRNKKVLPYFLPKKSH